jgi:MFS transporter, BCD family, chlorophyll transporter
LTQVIMMNVNPRLLRLSLFQFGLGFSTVVFTGTLNRVLISEENIPATVVGWLLSLSLFVAPIRVLMGARSDKKQQRQGYRRLPYVWFGSMLVFGGLSAAPFSLMFLSKSHAIAQSTPFAIGVAFSTIIFLIYAIGVHVAQTGYLALVTDLIPQRDRHSAVAFLWIAFIIGQIVSAFVISWWLREYSPGRLVQIMQSSSVVFIVLTLIAIYGQDKFGVIEGAEEAGFTRIRQVLSNPRNLLFFVIVFLGTFAITGQDVLLEPYGAQVLGMAVAETTRLTALLGFGMLIAMVLATMLYRRLASPLWIALIACVVGIVGFGLVISTSQLHSIEAFSLGAGVIGLANGLFLISTLSIVVSIAETETAGLYVGLWGLVQTTAIGIGTLLGGLTRDTAMRASNNVLTGYTTFYGAELVLCALTGLLVLVMLRMQHSLSPVATQRGKAASVFAGLTEIPGG